MQGGFLIFHLQPTLKIPMTVAFVLSNWLHALLYLSSQD